MTKNVRHILYRTWAKRGDTIELEDKVRSKVICCHPNVVIAIYNLTIGNIQRRLKCGKQLTYIHLNMAS